MGALYLTLLYLATGGALSWLVRRLLPTAETLSWRTTLLLIALPLVFTGGGFLPGRALAPTPSLIQTAPWLDPELIAEVQAGSSRSNPLLFDPLTQMIPWQRAARENLLFNPAQGGGAALLGNGQSAVLFPTEVAARLLSPLRGTTYSQAARLLVAVFGFSLLLRSLALSEVAALVGATAYLGSGFLQLWRLHPHSLVAAVAPWILWAALRLSRGPDSRTMVALGVAGAAGCLGGHPETLLHVILIAAVVAAAALARRLRGRETGRWRLTGRALAGAGGAALLATLLAAPTLLPLLENLRVAEEWQRRSEAVPDRLEVPFEEALERLAATLTPFAFGDPLAPPGGRPAGPENIVELAGGSVGAAVLMLAAAAFGDRRRRLEGGSPDPGAPMWLGLGLVALLVAAHTPWISKPFGAVPLLEISLPKRLSLGGALAAALLAAVGVDRLARGQGRKGLLVGAALVAGLLAAAAWALPGSRAGAGVPLEAAALAVACLAGWGLSKKPSPPGWRAACLVFLALALLLPRGLLFARWVPIASSLSFYPETLAVRDVAERLRNAPAGTRVAGLDAALLPHAAAFFGFEEARAYDPMTFAPYQRFLETLGEPRAQGGVRLLDPALPGLAFLGVRYVFDHPSMTHRPGVDVVYLGRDAIVYENPRALPRMFVPAEVEVTSDPEATFRALAGIGDFSQRVTVRGRPDLPSPGRYPNGSAVVSELTVKPRRLEARVLAEGLALVATSQPAIPGWRLWRNGQALEPVVVNGAFLGVPVEAGDSHLELVYAPRSWVLGWVLFILGLIAASTLAAQAGGHRLPLAHPPHQDRSPVT